MLQHHLTLSVLKLICRCVFHDCVFLFLVWFKKIHDLYRRKLQMLMWIIVKKRIIDSIVSFISLNYTCLWLYHKISLLKCLLGSKYGKCPLPNYLDEAEFTHIRNEAFEGGKGGWFNIQSFKKKIGWVYSYVQVCIRFSRFQFIKGCSFSL